MDSDGSPKAGPAEDGGELKPKTTRDELEDEQKRRLALDQKVAEGQKSIEDYYNRCSKLEQENDKLTNQLNQAHKEASVESGRKKRTDAELQRANEENATLREELENLKATRSERDKELAGKNNTITELEKKIQGWKNDSQETEVAMRNVEDENKIYARQNFTYERLQADHIAQIEGLRNDLHIVMQERSDLYESFKVLEETLPIEHTGDLGPEDLRDKLLDWMQQRPPVGGGTLRPQKRRGASMADELGGDESDGEEEEDHLQGAEEEVALPPANNSLGGVPPAPAQPPPANGDATTGPLPPPANGDTTAVRLPLPPPPPPPDAAAAAAATVGHPPLPAPPAPAAAPAAAPPNPPPNPPNPGVAVQVPPFLPQRTIWLIGLWVLGCLFVCVYLCCLVRTLLHERNMWLAANESTRETVIRLKGNQAWFLGTWRDWVSFKLQECFQFERSMPG